MTDDTGFAALPQVDGPLPAPEPVVLPLIEGAGFMALDASHYSTSTQAFMTSDLESMAMKLQLHTAMSRLSLRECREVLEFLEVQGLPLTTA